MMSADRYLGWRNSYALSDKSSDTTVELVDGRVIRIRRQPMPDGAWVATHEDITAQRRGEQALAEARAHAERAQQDAQAAHARLVEALEVVPEGIALMDADDRLVLWNRQYAETYKLTEKIVAGMSFEDILRDGLARGQYADAIGREEEWLAQRLALHRLPSNRFEQRLSTGRYIVVEERRTADGGNIGIRMDVTEIKEREESFRLLFNSNPVPMMVIDADTLKFIDVNEAALAYYGYSRERFLEMTALDIRRPEERPGFQRVHAELPRQPGCENLAATESRRHRYFGERVFDKPILCGSVRASRRDRRRHRAHAGRRHASGAEAPVGFGDREHVAGSAHVRQQCAARLVQPALS